MTNYLLNFVPVPYRDTKMLTALFLGFAAGIPLGLTGYTLSIWLTEVNINLRDIGLLSLCGACYSFKFVWSPFMDVLRIPILHKLFGHRTSWIIFIQALLIITIIALGFSDPLKGLGRISLLSFILSFLTASHDIVVDAYRTELVTKDQQTAVASAAVFGYRLGGVFTASFLLIIASYFSWAMGYCAAAAAILLGTIAVIKTGEPEISKNRSFDNSLPWRAYLNKMVIEPFTNFAERPKWQRLLLFILFFKLGDTILGSMLGPLYVQIGFSKTAVANVITTFGVIGTLIGSFVGGMVLYKIGIMRALWLTYFGQIFSSIVFAILAYIGNNINFLRLAILNENITNGMSTAVLIGVMGRLCNINYTATQFALFTSIASASRTMLAAPAGIIANSLGWPLYCLFTALACVPGMIILKGLKEEDLSS